MIKKNEKEAVALALEYGTKYAAEIYNVHARTIRKWRAKVNNQYLDFEVDDVPTGNLPIGELINDRINRFRLKNDYVTKTDLIKVKINVDGPIGIAHFGDPHVDDDGTDLELLLNHAKVVNDTEGMFAGNVGDLQNNWIGRISHLYSQQSTSAKDSWRLAEHFVNSVPWLYLVGGNHDVWSGAGDPLEWIMSHHGGVFKNWGVRLNLVFPNKKEVRVNCRHDFKGHSMWNTAHGVSKAIQMGWRDHVLTCGHTHVSGYQVLKDPSSGLISHGLRIGSYKIHDRYAMEKGLPDQNIFVCPVTIIDPQFADNDPRLITTIFDPMEAADYLTWKRKNHGKS
jgi:hypothetical protein